jgi:hypothetical protein
MSKEIVETVKHKKKESTLKWFIFALIPILNLYFFWKVAEIVSAHEKVSVPKEEI